MREKADWIGQLEILAAVVFYFLHSRELRGRRVVHYIDNSSAQAALVKGQGILVGPRLILHMIHAFWVGVGIIPRDRRVARVRTPKPIYLIGRLAATASLSWKSFSPIH